MYDTNYQQSLHFLFYFYHQNTYKEHECVTPNVNNLLSFVQ